MTAPIITWERRTWPVNRGKEPSLFDRLMDPDGQVVKEICGRCGETAELTLAEGREWFKQHRKRCK